MNKKGTPKNLQTGKENRIWASGEDLLADFYTFLDGIRESGYKETPTRTNFGRWAKADRHTVYLAIESYYPNIKKEFEQALSETLADGSMLGAYNTTMCIFCMKNWCGMAEKTEEKVKVDATLQTVEEYLRQFDED